MTQQRCQNDLSIDGIPVGVSDTQSGEVDPAEVPKVIRSITRGLASEQPPMNQVIVPKAARWWYIHGKGGTDPAFQWATEWARQLATDTPSEVDQFDAFLEYLVTIDFANEKAAIR